MLSKHLLSISSIELPLAVTVVQNIHFEDPFVGVGFEPKLFSYPLLSNKGHLGNYRNQFGQADYDQSFESRLKARPDGAR